jgi:5-oxopent-3-ene-1,2,5-tricarboxylate decarboxylase/2-hydroxyhepta-2,4-diene-1,7-dioate isomerase
MLTIDRSLIRLRGRAPLDAAPPAAGAHAAFEPAATRTVYGTLLNHRGALAALGEAVHQPPYQAPPRAPVLYIKPANTWIGSGAPIPVPAGIDELEMGAALAVVIGRTACRVGLSDALDHVAGYTIANDVSVPHAEFYRPSIRHKCRDGFLPIGPWVTARRLVADPDALELRVWVDGELRQRATTADLIRPIAQLLVDVTEFMTLAPGDVLLTGVPAGAPRARAGQQVAIEIDGLGRLENVLVPEAELAGGSA